MGITAIGQKTIVMYPPIVRLAVNYYHYDQRPIARWTSQRGDAMVLFQLGTWMGDACGIPLVGNSRYHLHGSFLNPSTTAGHWAPQSFSKVLGHLRKFLIFYK